MGRLLKRLELENGVHLIIEDESIRYYADLWNLKLVITGKIEVNPEHLAAITPVNAYEEQAKSSLGKVVIYRRDLTRTGIKECEKEEVIKRLLAAFEQNSLPYLRHRSFPERLVRTQWKKLAKEIEKQKRLMDA